MRFLWILVYFQWQTLAMNDSLFLVEQRKLNKLHCVSNNLDKAVVWNTPLEPGYTVSVEKEAFELNMTYTYRHIFPESILLSTKRSFGPVLDSRWESFPMDITTSDYSNITLAFHQFNVRVKLDFEIPFSLRAQKEAHLYICDGYNNPSQSNCIWFMIGAWNGQKSAIRDCKSGEINVRNLPPTGDCLTNHSEVWINPLKKDSFVHFIVQFSSIDRSISLKIFGEERPFLHYVLPKHKFEDRYVRVWGNTRLGYEGFWKLHVYYYASLIPGKVELFTLNLDPNHTFCFSLWAFICPVCKLILVLENDDDVIFKKSYRQDKDNSWQRIRFSYEKLSMGVDRLYAITNDLNMFTALHDMRVRDCAKEFKISTLTTNKEYLINSDKTPGVSCQYLLDDSKQIQPQALTDPAKFELKCPNGTIGPDCIPCEREGICNYGKVCQNDGDNVTCYCTDGFFGDSCEKSNLPIIKEPPKLLADCYTVCNFSIDPLNYEGKDVPTSYYYKLKVLNIFWENHMTEISEYFNVEVNNFLILGLEKLINYSLEIILCTRRDHCISQGAIPVLNFTTKCRDIQIDDVIMDSDDHTISFNIKDDADELCLHKYILVFSDIEEIGFLRSNNTVHDLKPNTEYYFEFKERQIIVISGHFSTKGDAPSVVTEVVFNTTSDQIYARWMPPKYPNGEILGYNIVLQHESYISCRDKKNDPSLIRNLNVTKTEIFFKSLHPYSTYNVSISAMSSKFGDVLSLLADTKDVDYLIPNAFTVIAQLNDTLPQISLKVNCTLLYSAHTVTITTVCKEEFVKCPNASTISEDGPIRSLKLAPFAEYQLNTQVVNIFNRSIDLEVVTFKTQPAAPNAIRNLNLYDLDDKSITFNFLPPHPPTGEIEKYYIKIKRWNARKNATLIYDGVINANTCELWNWMICIKTPTLLKRGKYYYIDVLVKNKEVAQLSAPSSHEGYLEYKVPEKVYNITGVWDEFYNLTIFWNHPNKTNGKLTNFFINVGSNDLYDYNVETYQLTYNYTIAINEVDDVITKIAIRSRNKKHDSPYLECIINNPPPTPRFENAPKINEITNCTIKIDIAPIEALKGTSYLYIIIIKDKEESDLENSVKQTEQINKWLDLPFDGKTAWIALSMHFIPDLTASVVIGTGSYLFMEKIEEKIQNRVLASSKNIEIYLIATNERNGFERFSSIKIPYANKPKTQEVLLSTTSFHHWIYITLLGLIIFVITCVIYTNKIKLFPSIRPSVRTDNLPERTHKQFIPMGNITLSGNLRFTSATEESSN